MISAAATYNSARTEPAATAATAAARYIFNVSPPPLNSMHISTDLPAARHVWGCAAVRFVMSQGCATGKSTENMLAGVPASTKSPAQALAGVPATAKSTENILAGTSATTPPRDAPGTAAWRSDLSSNKPRRHPMFVKKLYSCKKQRQQDKDYCSSLIFEIARKVSPLLF
ncbi:MAG: hypothetical protein LBU98_03380, partial [Alistipes sp.]|nr:hypothetical protein [Alistipes sp.]